MDLYTFLSTLNLSLGGLVFLLGLIILRENPGQRLNRVVAMMLFFGGFGAVLAALDFLGRGGAAAAPDLLDDLSYVWEFFFPTLFLFAAIFPEERTFMRRRLRPFARWEWLAAGASLLIFAPHVFHLVAVQISHMWEGGSPQVPRVGPFAYLAPVVALMGVVVKLFLLVHSTLFSLVNLGFGLAAILLLFGSLRRARLPRLRQQILVIAIGLAAAMACYSFATSIPTLLNFRLPEAVRSSLTIAALMLGPGSIAYAIVRYKFLDTKLLARRGILYAMGSGALVGLYLVAVRPLNEFMRQISGLNANVFEPVFLVMSLALIQPAVAWLEALLDRMFLKDPGDYRNVVRELGRELQTTIDLDVVLSRTARTLAEALLLRSAHVVALPPEAPVAHTGAGRPLADDELRALSAMLPRMSAQQTSWRLSDRVEGLSAAEQAYLTDTLGLSLLVPLRWGGDLVGALLLGEKLLGTSYTAEDVQLLTALASQVSVSLQNAMLLRDRLAVVRFEEELNLARQIQRKSLLSEFPPVPRCDVHAVYRPSKHVGGDFYDVVPTGDGGYLIAIADVSGKGVPAALLSAMLQASLRTQAGSVRALPAMLHNINQLLYRSTSTQQFATFFLGRIDGQRLTLEFSNAGHNWPVVLRPNGEQEWLECGGTILGILEDTPFDVAQVDLGPGDLVVLYTDGVSEAADASAEQFGEKRLAEFVQSLPPGLSAREIAERCIERLFEFLGDVEPQDDVTLLVLRVLEPAASPALKDAVPEIVGAG